jgi:3'-phosphoadenosine 5'-phosphosulfate sulfotransferase (PAPS reductase)/FAD synthetase
MKKLFIPKAIRTALESGAALVFSVSGGKDSEAAAKAVSIGLAAAGLSPRSTHFVHADLGRMEWLETPGYVTESALVYGYPLAVVRRDFDLLQGIENRFVTRPDAPPFPSAAARYCTAGWKRQVINSWIGHTFNRDTTVIQIIGLRRDESKGRAKTPNYSENELASAPTKGRRVINWYPIAGWTLADVWACLGVSLDELAAVQAQVKNGATPDEAGWLFHPAYAYGNERLSCALCVLAGKNDLLNGAQHNPALYRALVDLEIKSGFTFKQDLRLSDLRPDLLTEAQRLTLAIGGAK